MPVRRPPDEHNPRIIRRVPQPPPQAIRYEEPKRSFGRRVLRFLTWPYIAIPAVVAIALCATVLVYYWIIFSGRIDNLLKGEVFTRSAGIYAAPKQLRVGETLSPDKLVELLKHEGYVEKTQQADKARGRYSVGDNAVDVEPSENNSIDGQRQFQNVRVQFAKSGKAISSLTDLENNGHLDKAWLEPELISSVTGRERAKRKVIGFNDVPNSLRDAIVVTEDRSFFQH